MDLSESQKEEIFTRYASDPGDSRYVDYLNSTITFKNDDGSTLESK